MAESGQSTQGHIPSADPAPAPTAPVPAAAPVAAARRAGLLVTLVLGGLTALPPLSMDMYLPALPAVTDSLRAPPRQSSSRSPPASRAWRSASSSSAR